MVSRHNRRSPFEIREHAGAAPTFVVLGDLGARARLWEPCMELIGPRPAWLEVDLGAVDAVRPESTEPDPFDPGEQVRALYEALVIERELPPFVLIGHGYGALTTEEYAAEMADTLLGLVLVNPLHDHIDAWSRTLLEDEPAGLTRAPLGAAVASLLEESWWAEARLVEQAQREVRALIHPENEATLRLPVLCILGDEAPFSLMERALGVRRRSRDGMVCVVNGAGHLPMLETPAVTSAAIERFLLDLPGQRRGPAPGAWGGGPECVWPEPAPGSPSDAQPDPVAEAFARGTL